MDLANLATMVLSADTLGAIILAGFFGLLGFLVKGLVQNHGTIRVAQINSETTLGTKAIETLTTALEVLQEENKSLKVSMRQLDSHIDRLIDHILRIIKATDVKEIEHATNQLEQFLRSIGRWPY